MNRPPRPPPSTPSTAAARPGLASRPATRRHPRADHAVALPLDRVAIGALVGLSIDLWRASANRPQLNKYGMTGHSADGWLAPVLTFVVLSVYADLRPPRDPHGYAQVRAAATIIALAVNVITI